MPGGPPGRATWAVVLCRAAQGPRKRSAAARAVRFLVFSKRKPAIWNEHSKSLMCAELLCAPCGHGAARRYAMGLILTSMSFAEASKPTIFDVSVSP
jgi:hypothetical protein